MFAQRIGTPRLRHCPATRLHRPQLRGFSAPDEFPTGRTPEFGNFRLLFGIHITLLYPTERPHLAEGTGLTKGL